MLLQHRSASSSRLSLDFPDLPGKPAYTLKPGQPSPGQHSLLRPPFAVTPSTGILTCFPSTTLFSLALGADSPCSDERRTGNLGLAASGLFTRFNVTHVSIRTSGTSSGPRGSAFAGLRNAPLPLASLRIRGFGYLLSPVTSSAQKDSISELLRFL